jgi:alpha-L-fucosidase
VAIHSRQYVAEVSATASIHQLTLLVGLSFGYNRNEADNLSLTGHDAICMLIDVSSTGGNFLLNVGPDADGNLPAVQRKCLEGLGAWMSVNEAGIHDTEPVSHSIATPLGIGPKPVDLEPWVRWNRRGSDLFGFIEGQGHLVLPVDRNIVDLDSCELINGEKVQIKADGTIDLEDLQCHNVPVCLKLHIRP